MNITPEGYMQRLIEISSKKRELLKDILGLTSVQSGCITEDRIEELKKIIEKKQKKIDEIDNLDEEFNIYFQRLKSRLGVKSLDELKGAKIEGAERLQQVVKEVVGTIKKISEIEKQNNDMAKQLLDKLSGEIKKISDGKRVSSAYKPTPVQMPSYYFDKKK